MSYSEKIKAIKELAEIVKEFAFPSPQQEPQDVQKMKAAAAVVRDMGELVARLQAVEDGHRQVAALVSAISSEVGKIKAMVAVALAVSAAAVLIALLAH